MKIINVILIIFSIILSFPSQSQDLWLDVNYYQEVELLPTKKFTHHDKLATIDSNQSSTVEFSGQVYNTIKIGDQVWLSENLNTSFYKNGDPISDGNQIGDISKEDKPAYWFDYNNNLERGYGKLYTWQVVMDARGVCPENFHVATKEDWDKLIAFSGGTARAGDALKSKDKDIWTTTHVDYTQTDFNASPARLRPADESYCILDPAAFWWIPNESLEKTARAYSITSNASEITLKFESINVGMSIRCVMNE